MRAGSCGKQKLDALWMESLVAHPSAAHSRPAGEVRFGREAKIRCPLSSGGRRGCSVLSSHIVGSVEYLGRF